MVGRGLLLHMHRLFLVRSRLGPNPKTARLRTEPSAGALHVVQGSAGQVCPRIHLADRGTGAMGRSDWLALARCHIEHCG